MTSDLESRPFADVRGLQLLIILSFVVGAGDDLRDILGFVFETIHNLFVSKTMTRHMWNGHQGDDVGMPQGTGNLQSQPLVALGYVH